MHKMPQIQIGNQTAFSAVSLRDPFDYALANGFDAFEWFPDKKPWCAGWDESNLDAGPSLLNQAREGLKQLLVDAS